MSRDWQAINALIAEDARVLQAGPLAFTAERKDKGRAKPRTPRERANELMGDAWSYGLALGYIVPKEG